MSKNLFLLIAIAFFAAGIGIYFAKGAVLNVLSPYLRQNSLSEFLAVADNAPAGENSARETSPAGGQKNISSAPAGKSSANAAAKKTIQTEIQQQPATITNTASNQTATSVEISLCSFNNNKTPSGSALINEVAWAGTASDKTSQEWIELKNNSGAEISLNGWQIQNASQNIKIFFGVSDSISAGGFYLLERGSSDFISGIKADKFFTNAVKNSDEAIRLFDKNCGLADEVSADIGGDKNWPAGEAKPDYRTAERSPDLTWHTYNGSVTNGIMGTPRAENSPRVVVSSGNQSGSLLSPPPAQLAYYTFQVFKSGNGNGSITSNPLGIFCASSCAEESEDFISGTSVALIALADNDSEFAGWSGDCAGNATCSFSMNSNKSVTAIFNQVVSSTPLPPPPLLPSVSSPARSNATHILISQVQATGGAGQTTNDFIEIYNPTGDQFNLKGYRLVKRSASSAADTSIKSWTTDTFMPAYGFYLWVNSAYTTISVTPDAATTATIADNNGIAIRFGSENTGEIIDALAWGNFQNVLFEGTAFSINPGPNQSILRKGWQNSCVAASYDKSVGNGCDTDNNVSDFEMTQNSNPRNSTSF